MSDATPPPVVDPEPSEHPPPAAEPESPANPPPAEPKSRFFWVMPLLSVVSTVMTVIISVQQIQMQSAQVAFARSQEQMKADLQAINLLKEQLDLRTTTEQQTTVFVQLMREGIEKMAIADAAKKASIQIALLDLIAAARTGDTGEVSEQNKKDIRLFAIRLAMLSENHDAIAHIGYDRVDEWLPLAKKSSYPEARATAIRALGQMALFQDQGAATRGAERNQADWIFFVLEAIMDLSRGLSSQDAATAAAIEEIAKIQSFLTRRENLNLNADQQRSLDRIKKALNAAGSDAGSNPAAAKTKSIEAGVAAIEGLQQQVQDMAGPARSDDFGKLLQDLLSDKKERRITARAALARNPAFDQMAAFLKQNQDSYYAWVGIAAVLNQVKDWETLDANTAETFATLLASQQSDVRQQTLSAFSKVRNQAARDHLTTACNKLLDHHTAAGAVPVDQVETVFDLFRQWLEQADNLVLQRAVFREIQRIVAKLPEDERGDKVRQAFADVCRPVWIDESTLAVPVLRFSVSEKDEIQLLGTVGALRADAFVQWATLGQIKFFGKMFRNPEPRSSFHKQWVKVLQIKPFLRPAKTAIFAVTTGPNRAAKTEGQPCANAEAQVKIDSDGFLYVQISGGFKPIEGDRSYRLCDLNLNGISYLP